MINAGLTIFAFTGTQQYNSATESWDGIKVKVNYPTLQNPTDNPITVKDYVIEDDGKIWKVIGAVEGTNGEYTLSIKIANFTPDVSISPNLGLVNRGSIVSPVNGKIEPYWNPVLVSNSIPQIAKIYNLVNPENVNNSLQEGANGTVRVVKQFDFDNTSDSSSPTTGGLVSRGGLGISKSVTVGGTIKETSDIRLKSDITLIENALEKVSKIHGYTYIKKGEKMAGVIAQEMQEVLPEVVTEGSDGYLAVSYNNIISLLINAINEQQSQIDILKQK